MKRKEKSPKQDKNSIVKKFLKISRSASVMTQVGTLLFVLLLLVFIPAAVISWRYAQNGVRQIEQSNTWLLQSYMSQIDREMDTVEQYLYNLVYRNDDTYNLTNKDDAAFYYSANELQGNFKKNLLNYEYLSAVYVIVPKEDFVCTYIRNVERVNEEKLLQEVLVEKCGKEAMSADDGGAWQFMEIDGELWLNWYYTNDGIWGGAMFAVNDLPMPDETSSGQDVSFVTESGLKEVLSGADSGETVLYAKSESLPFYICETYDSSEDWAMLPFMQRYATLLVIGFLLIFIFSFLALDYWMIRPLRKLIRAMEKLESGDLDYRIPEEAPNYETGNIFRTFNQMTDQIRNLKISVYEEKLQHRKTELNNLSYQLRPHFMVNSMNMVYNLILTGDYESARKLTLVSARYLRYLLSVTDDFVPLKEEIAHLGNYLEIQKIRYENLFDYEIQIDPFVEGIMIPSMLLVNFAENSVKYSMDPNQLNRLLIAVDYLEKEGELYARLQIKDNGQGYPEWLISALQERNMEALEQRIGLKNNLLRMQMLFGDKAECRFYNGDGAVTEFEFPL